MGFQMPSCELWWRRLASDAHPLLLETVGLQGPRTEGVRRSWERQCWGQAARDQDCLPFGSALPGLWVWTEGLVHQGVCPLGRNCGDL